MTGVVGSYINNLRSEIETLSKTVKLASEQECKLTKAIYFLSGVTVLLALIQILIIF